MSDTNVHRVVGNLLVGTSHFFVDTTTNQVGINTSSPSASLDVATGDVKVGSSITLASSTGIITATGGFSGDGSGLSGVNSDSGSWVNGSSSNVHLAVSTDNVGIGMDNPNHKLDVAGDINISSGSTLRVGGTPAVFSNWSVDGSDIYRSSGNVGIGTNDPQGGLHVQADNRVHITAGTVAAFTGTSASNSTGTSRAQLVLNSRYSDLVIASSYVNNNHGSTLSFATVNPSNTAEYRKFVINQGNWGSRKDFLDFGLSASASDPNPHSSINSTDTVLTLDGNNKRVGIGAINPNYKLHVNGNIRADTGKRNLFYAPTNWSYETSSTSGTILWSFTYNFPYDGYANFNVNGHFHNNISNKWVYAKVVINGASTAATSGYYDSHTVGGAGTHGGDFHSYKDSSVSWQDFNWGGTLKVSAGTRTIGLYVRVSGGIIAVNGAAINMLYIPTNIF